jgi:hypothetical protein|tara:strand:- start:1 stop:216 length:216 start_codon:yes stop_codon:yes gene_type:complete
MIDLTNNISRNNMIAIILLMFGKFFGIIAAGAIFAFREYAPLFLTLYAVGVFGSITLALYEMFKEKEENVY